MSVSEVAKALGKSESTIYKLIRRGVGVGEVFVYKPGLGYKFVGNIEEFKVNG